MQRTTATTCLFTKEDGERCRARAMRDSEYCFFHDPATLERRRAARRAGGIERSKKAAVLPADAVDCPLESVGHIVELLAQTINQVRKGTADPRVGNSVGYLAGIMLKALDIGELEKRLAKLESLVQRQPPELDHVFEDVLAECEPSRDELYR